MEYISADLDLIDREILEILSKDGRISYAELSILVHRSPSAVRKRVEKLVRNRIIERFTIILNQKRVGRALTATLTINPASRRLKRITEFVARMPYVIEAYHMTGKCGILAIVQVGDIAELNDCIQEIQNLEGVLEVEACIALKKIK